MNSKGYSILGWIVWQVGSRVANRPSVTATGRKPTLTHRYPAEPQARWEPPRSPGIGPRPGSPGWAGRVVMGDSAPSNIA